MKWGKLAPALRVAVKIGPYFVVILDCGPATAFGLPLVSTPTDEDLSAGAPVLARFSSATPLRAKVNNRL
jgi:hypothetical protein